MKSTATSTSVAPPNMAGSLHARGTLAKFFVLGAGAMFAYLVLVPLLHMGGAGHSLVQQGHAHATPSTASLRDTRDSQHGVAVRPEDGADPGRAVAARRREGTASERHAEVHEMLHGIVSKALADHAREAKRLQESEGRGHIAERPAPQDPEALAIAHAEMAKKAAALALQDVQVRRATFSFHLLTPPAIPPTNVYASPAPALAATAAKQWQRGAR